MSFNQKNKVLLKKVCIFTALALMSMAILFSVFLAGYQTRSQIYSYATERGYLGTTFSRHVLFSFPKKIINNYLESLKGKQTLLSLQIMIKPKHYQKLSQKRDKAMARGKLISADDDYVPARIKVGEKIVKVKLRLKGDGTDHIDSKRWSFRIKVSGGDHIFGFRKFSIQNPKTRLYQREIIFLNHFREEGVLAPRSDLINLTLNGENLGAMQLEEHFAKEMLESMERRESAILKFDESYAWQLALWKYGMWSVDYAQVDAFERSKLKKSPTMEKWHKSGAKLLLAFQKQTLEASDIFDVELTAKFIAINEIWDLWHSLSWNNIRFYYNPVTTKLEPIAYDVSAPKASANHMVLNSLALGDHALGRKWLADKKIQKAFVKHLRILAKKMQTGEFDQFVAQRESKFLPHLRTDFPLIGKIPMAALKQRAKKLLSLNEENFNRERVAQPSYEQAIKAFARKEAGGVSIEILNLVAKKQQIQSITYRGESSKSLLAVNQTPILQSATEDGKASRIKLFFKRDFDMENGSFVVKSIVLENKKTFSVTASNYFHAANSPVLASMNSMEIIKKYPFLKLVNREFLVKKGNWLVNETIIFPENHSLSIPAATKISFAENAFLLVKGSLQVNGTRSNPVILKAKNTSWPGIAVIGAKQVSHISHLKMQDYRSINTDFWETTGGLSFLYSDVEMDSIVLENAMGEDALNIYASNFNISNSKISKTFSDALDSDFSVGTIVNSKFVSVGGDAVDVSGTQITLNQVHFNKIHDKAISVGEKSNLLATNINIHEAGTAIASKDNSRSKLENIEMSEIKYYGLMAYIKKPEYGGSKLEAKNIKFQGASRSLAQTGSQVIIDGAETPNQEIDIESIYKQGFMKK